MISAVLAFCSLVHYPSWNMPVGPVSKIYVLAAIEEGYTGYHLSPYLPKLPAFIWWRSSLLLIVAILYLWFIQQIDPDPHFYFESNEVLVNASCFSEGMKAKALTHSVSTLCTEERFSRMRLALEACHFHTVGKCMETTIYWALHREVISLAN